MHPLTFKYVQLDVIRQCNLCRQSVADYVSYMHANGMRPCEAQSYLELLATLGYHTD